MIEEGHAYCRRPYIQLAEANLDTGAVGEWRIIWNGTGGMVGVASLPARRFVVSGTAD